MADLVVWRRAREDGYAVTVGMFGGLAGREVLGNSPHILTHSSWSVWPGVRVDPQFRPRWKDALFGGFV
jgi:hypothetical protein